TLAAGVAVVLADARPVPIVRLPLHGEGVAAYRWLAEHGEHRPVLELPAFLSPMDLDQLLASGRYMVASTLHWSPLVNGYTGHPPPSYALLAPPARRLPDPVVSGLHGWFAVTVTNSGSAPWPGLTTHARGRVALQARWRDTTGAVVLEGEPGLLARDLAPGESVEVPVGSMMPRPGSYTLEIGLSQDGIGWFAEQPGGARPVTAPVRARPWGEISPPQR